MFQKLIKKTNLDVEERTLSVRYYETRTLHGDARFSAEVVFQPEDHIILNADSVNRLETQVAVCCTRRCTAARSWESVPPCSTAARRLGDATELARSPAGYRPPWFRCRDYYVRTESFSGLAIRALTTVLAAIGIWAPVEGLRPILAGRFCTTSLTMPGNTNSPARFSSASESA